MSRYIVRRVLMAIPTLIGVTLLAFTLTNLLPGDPARVLAGRYATHEQVAATRERLGLDRPLHIQYATYIANIVRGDFGHSFQTRQSVSKEMVAHFPATLELALVAMTLAVVAGVPLGVITGTGKSPWVNSVVMFLALLGVGLPVFWAGLMFQWFFYGHLNILPLSGRLHHLLSPPPMATGLYTIDAIISGQWDTFLDAVRHLILPSVTLGLAAVASVTRITHASMVKVMRHEYIRAARSKGLSEFSVLSRHALKNALLPTVTTVAMQLGWLMGGTLLAEFIFTWPGLGSYAWRGIQHNDLPVVMGVTLLTTVTFLVLNLLADITYGYLDPRITYD